MHECGEILAPKSQLLNAKRQYNAFWMGLNQDNLMLGLSKWCAENEDKDGKQTHSTLNCTLDCRLTVISYFFLLCYHKDVLLYSESSSRGWKLCERRHLISEIYSFKCFCMMEIVW